MPSAEVSLEDAAKCPKCKKPGMLKQALKQTDGGHANAYECDTPLCPWFKTGWVVSTDREGNVYQRDQGDRGQDKDFQRMTPQQMARGQRYTEEVRVFEERMARDGIERPTS